MNLASIVISPFFELDLTTVSNILMSSALDESVRITVLDVVSEVIVLFFEFLHETNSTLINKRTKVKPKNICLSI